MDVMGGKITINLKELY